MDVCIYGRIGKIVIFPTSDRTEHATLITPRAISTVVARFLHTEEVTGSNPVSPISA